MNGRSIQNRLSWSLAALTFVCLASTSLLIYYIASTSLRDSNEAEIQRHAARVRQIYLEHREAKGWQELRKRLEEFFRTHEELGVDLQQHDRSFFQSIPTFPNARWLWQSMPTHASQPEVTLRLGINTANDYELLNRLITALSAITLLGTLVASLTAALLVRRGLRPLKQLADAAESIGPKEGGKRIDAKAYGHEIEPFALQFNALLERTERAYQELEAFNANVAHELRTPLANLISQSEVELAKPRSPEELRETLASNLEEAHRLSHLVTDMLFLSHADRGVQARREPIDSLAFHMGEVVEFHESDLDLRGQVVEVEGDATLSGDVSLIRRAVSNLIANAARYALERSVIVIRIQENQDEAWLHVINRGPSLEPGQESQIFNRFYRAHESRRGEHFGLGLSIVAAIAKMHGGRVQARSFSGRTDVGFSVHKYAKTAVSQLASRRVEV